MMIIPEGSVHGRFQPFHNGHVNYLLEAKSRCEYIWIGITQYDIRALQSTPAADHRVERENNPLTYFERLQIIAESLIDIGITKNDFGFVPFPIENPTRLPDFLPITIPCFTTVCEEWNRHKIRLLEAQGYEVIVLWEKEYKEVNGLEIRHQIRTGQHGWQSLVPPATIRAVERYKVRDRLLQASGCS
jgi:cytidyltransferase-like protein